MRVAIVTVLFCVCWAHIHAGPVEIVETVAQDNIIQGEAEKVDNKVDVPLSPAEVEQAAVEEVQADSNARISNCPNGWMKHGTRCYLIVPSSKTWFDAETFCIEKNAHLASVQSSTEYSFLQSLTTLAEQSNAWIGGFWLQGVWGWTNRLPYSYSNWYSKRTDSSNSCLLMYSTAGWTNLPCSYSHPFICAKDIWAC